MEIRLKSESTKFHDLCIKLSHNFLLRKKRQLFGEESHNQKLAKKCLICKQDIWLDFTEKIE